MRTEPAELLRDALSLPAEVRAVLIDSLLESQDGDTLDAAIDANAQEAWRDEIHRRLRQIDGEGVRIVLWAEVQKTRHSFRPSFSGRAGRSCAASHGLLYSEKPRAVKKSSL
jgi:hypothetical protein